MKRLTSVHITHDYYASGRKPPVRIVPTPNTAALLRKHNLYLRHHTAGMEIHSPEAEPEYEAMCFFVVPENPQLFYTTALPDWKEGTLLHFDMLADQDENTPLPGTLLPVHHPKTILPLPGDKAVHVTVQDTAGTTIIDFTTDATAQRCTIDLSAEPEGKYTISLDEEVINTFISLQTNVPTYTIGLIELPAWAAKAVLASYTLHFTTYEVFYKYFISSKNEEEWNITDRDGKLNFIPATTENLGGSSPYKGFISNKKITLSDRMQHSFGLYMNEKLVLDTLPGPNPESIKPGSDTTDYYAEIFINT